MVCPNCGTLNRSDTELCFQCKRPLAESSLRVATRCVLHPERPAQDHCSVCGSGLCEDCGTVVSGVVYCHACAGVLESGGVDREPVLRPEEMLRLRPATVGARMAAGLMDMALVGCGAITLALLFWMLTGAPPGAPTQPDANLLFWLLAFVGTGAYFVLTIASDGATPGYGQMDLVLVRSDGTLVDLRTALVRFLASVLSALCLMAGFLWMVLDKERRAWHDHLAGTYVVQRDDLGV